MFFTTKKREREPSLDGCLETSSLKIQVWREHIRYSIRCMSLPCTFLTLDPDCMDYKPSTYFLKTRFKINAAGLGGGNSLAEKCSFRVVLYRGCYGDCMVLMPLFPKQHKQKPNPLRFKTGRLKGPRGRAAQPVVLRTCRQR